MRVILNNARNERLVKDLQVISDCCAGISFPGDSSQAQNDRTLVFHSNDKRGSENDKRGSGNENTVVLVMFGYGFLAKYKTIVS